MTVLSRRNFLGLVGLGAVATAIKAIAPAFAQRCSARQRYWWADADGAGEFGTKLWQLGYDPAYGEDSTVVIYLAGEELKSVSRVTAKMTEQEMLATIRADIERMLRNRFGHAIPLNKLDEDEVIRAVVNVPSVLKVVAAPVRFTV